MFFGYPLSSACVPRAGSANLPSQSRAPGRCGEPQKKTRTRKDRKSLESRHNSTQGDGMPPPGERRPTKNWQPTKENCHAGRPMPQKPRPPSRGTSATVAGDAATMTRHCAAGERLAAQAPIAQAIASSTQPRYASTAAAQRSAISYLQPAVAPGASCTQSEASYKQKTKIPYVVEHP